MYLRYTRYIRDWKLEILIVTTLSLPSLFTILLMLIVFVLLSSLMEQCLGWLSPMLPSDRHSSRLRVSFFEPGNKFGNKNYWDKTYRDGNEGLCEDEFSWYCGWNEELEPFFIELVGTSAKVLIPGIGNDGCIRDMFDAGYTHLTYQLRKLGMSQL
jgi:hypothetical protein